MKKAILVLSLLIFLVSAAKADVASCAGTLNRLAMLAILEGEPCEDCAKNLINAVRSGPELVTLMTNWVSSGVVPIQNLNELQSEAKKSGVEVLEDFSSQLALSGSPDSKLLTTLAFRGSKKHIEELFEAHGEVYTRDLAHFEILDDLKSQVPLELVSMNSANISEKELILTNSLKESPQKIILINDQDSNAFMALVGESVLSDLSRFAMTDKDTVSKVIVSIDAKSLSQNWKRNISPVQTGKRFLKVGAPYSPEAYLMALNDLSLLQAERAKLLAQLFKSPIPRSPIKSSVTPDLETKVLSLSISDFVIRRGDVFKKNKFVLSEKSPTFQITRYNSPTYIGFSPKYFGETPVDEIIATYKRLGQIEPDEKIPKKVLAFIESYKKGKPWSNTYSKYSLSDFGPQYGFSILSDGYKYKKPIVASQQRSQGTEDEMLLLPVVKK